MTTKQLQRDTKPPQRHRTASDPKPRHKIPSKRLKNAIREMEKSKTTTKQQQRHEMRHRMTTETQNQFRDVKHHQTPEKSRDTKQLQTQTRKIQKNPQNYYKATDTKQQQSETSRDLYGYMQCHHWKYTARHSAGNIQQHVLSL